MIFCNLHKIGSNEPEYIRKYKRREITRKNTHASICTRTHTLKETLVGSEQISEGGNMTSPNYRQKHCRERQNQTIGIFLKPRQNICHFIK